MSPQEKSPLFEKAIDAVPDYKVFLTVDELNESSRKLAEKYPDLVTHSIAGHSRRGDPIPLLTIGDGSRAALLFGCPHPNEPIGAMMLEYLTWELATNDELRAALDYTWYIIKVVDPDSTRLNEGWFKGPFTATNYARHYYRPPSFQQVEWTFPVQYKKLEFDDPMPETQALMKVMQEARPDFMFSLHNCGFGGVYFYLSEESPRIYDVLHRLPAEQGLPLSLGEPEMPYAETFARAIYRLPTKADAYDFIESNTDLDPTEVLTGGTSSDDYARRFADTLTLVCEMPYFYDERIVDTSDTEVTRREAVLENVATTRQRLEFMRKQWDRMADRLELESPFVATVRSQLKTAAGQLAARENWARTADDTDRPATVAELFDNRETSAFYQLLSLGVFRRLVEEELSHRIEIGKTETAAMSTLNEVNEELTRYFKEASAELEGSLDYRVIPIQKLVRVQLGSALYLMDYVQHDRVSQRD